MRPSTLHKQQALALRLLPPDWVTGGVGFTPDGRLAVRVGPGLAHRSQTVLRAGGVRAPLDIVEMHHPRARNPSHPELDHPISFDQLFHELSWVCDLPRARVEDFDVVIEPSVTAEHEQNARRYAQVTASDRPPLFEFAEQTLLLPWPHRLGLYAHEVGHVLDPDPRKTEPGADQTAHRELGVQIGYDRRWPGKGLQVAIEGPGVR